MLATWRSQITHHTILHENTKHLMETFRYDAHPMGMFISTVAALSTFYPEARQVHDPTVRLEQVKRLIAKVPTIAAFSYRHSLGLPYNYPSDELSYTGDLLQMLIRMAEASYTPNPLLDVALELEHIALEDEYFIKRKLYPNVDFYTGIIYQAMGLPVELYPVLFAIPRTSGWLAQWLELLDDPEQRIARPRQVYAGAATRDYVSLAHRA